MPDEFEAFPMSALYLPGTVALPSPFPTVGKVWLPSPDFECMPGLLKKHHLHLVAIGNLVPPSRSIVRYVRLEHISAMFLLAGKYDESEAVNWQQGEWLYAPSLEDLKGQLKPKSRAIVYVPENAPVMTQTVFGTTAAESAEYIHPFRTSCDP